jgi:hypothetical protein
VVVAEEPTVADSHSAVTQARGRDVSSAEKKATFPASAPTRVDAAPAEPPQNAISVVRRATSLASAPRAVATSASTARRRVTSHAIVRPSGR